MARRNTVLFSLIAALAIAATAAPAASASPAWKFSGKSLEGTETILGNAAGSAMTFPGLVTSCKNLHYKMKITNMTGTGRGEITEAQFEDCVTDDEDCTVAAIAAETLPWPLHLSTVSSKDYVILEGIKVSILYEGDLCALGETWVKITGTAGGLFENPTSTISFDASTFSTTKTALKAFGTKVEWEGVFTTEATGIHAGEKLEG